MPYGPHNFVFLNMDPDPHTECGSQTTDSQNRGNKTKVKFCV